MKLATSHLTGREAVTLILDYAETAPEDEVPGLEGALASLLSADEVPASAAIAAVRRDAERRALVAEHVRISLLAERAVLLAADLDELAEDPAYAGAAELAASAHDVAESLLATADAMEAPDA